MTFIKRDWDSQYYHGWTNRYPFTEVVSFIMRNFSAAPDRSKIRILDLGCGGGHHLVFLAQEGFDYYGVDGASKALEISKERLESRGFTPKNLALATFDKLPYADDYFDAVIDRGALVCNRGAEIGELLGEIRRVMKPGAKLLSTIFHESDPSREGATSLGDNDFTNFQGRLKDASVLHYTNPDDARRIFGAFDIYDIQKHVVTSEHPGPDSRIVSAWMHILCSK